MARLIDFWNRSIGDLFRTTEAKRIIKNIAGTSGSSQTLQQVLTQGSTLTTNNVIDGGQNSLFIQNNSTATMLGGDDAGNGQYGQLSLSGSSAFLYQQNSTASKFSIVEIVDSGSSVYSNINSDDGTNVSSVKVDSDEVSITVDGFVSSFLSNGSFTINSPSPHVWFQFTAPSGAPAALGLVTSQASQQAEVHFETNGATWRIQHTGNAGSNVGQNAFVFTNGGNVNLALDTAGHVGIGIDAALTSFLDIAPSTTSSSALRLRAGTAPTSPNDGDIWFDGSSLKIRVAGQTKTFTLS